MATVKCKFTSTVVTANEFFVHTQVVLIEINKLKDLIIKIYV
jgi:hypothetical protein